MCDSVDSERVKALLGVYVFKFGPGYNYNGYNYNYICNYIKLFADVQTLS
jgi:hypothetical protein